MIVQTYKGTRPKTTYHSMPPLVPMKQQQQNWPIPVMEPRPNADDRRRATQFNIDAEEFVRRDKLVRQMWVDCGFKPGEVVRPKSDIAYEKYGRCTIRGVYKSYHDFSTGEGQDWPKNDRPFIITVDPDKKDNDTRLLLVVPDWLARFYP
jgi:hypothetical protein